MSEDKYDEYSFYSIVAMVGCLVMFGFAIIFDLSLDIINYILYLFFLIVVISLLLLVIDSRMYLFKSKKEE